ncbi:unnamed protein product (macronuclear) [Paramecium tetraurelia]|uniref:Uncharacterized protein n=1 Tax=Paramecium tetraurelia TaxID=5888 RepID=A0EH46_PARTE|nr:uncharacterized protein GSPATT00026961001 [Paramecium tetraurelia]CAK94637.1 unnamed protein product [Paramecium tetraurelia]|eukprot:XP_001462010.1 hypothetical protein (macronuclear) [Paramecium tetraurelia strain d4-2]
MDELLGAIQQRKAKINEIQEAIYQIKGNQQQERLTVYSMVRKLKEEEKIRAEKENWIIGVIRNTKQYNEEQMWYIQISNFSHIYVKTNEMMKAISNQFLEIPYTPTCNMYQYLENYYTLHSSFQKHLNQDTQLKVQFKQAVRVGNISLVTDLIKSLLGTSRKQYRDFVEELSNQVKKEPSPQKIRIENQRIRSSTQKIEEVKLVEKPPTTTMINKVDRIKRKQITISKIQSSCDLSPTTETPTLYLRNKFKEIEKAPFASMFANITTVIEDLDEQNIQICDYQTVKRQSQNYEEFKTNYDALCDKIRLRNNLIQQSVFDYTNYALKRVQNVETEYPNLIKEKYTTLQNNQDYHFCNIQLKPIFDSLCPCMQKQTVQPKMSPIKNKVIIRKSILQIKNLINNLKKNKLMQANTTIVLITTGSQNNKCPQLKLYKDAQLIKPHPRALSANTQQQPVKYLTCSSFIENPIAIKTNLLVRSTYE